MMEYIKISKNIMKKYISQFVEIDNFYYDLLGNKFTTFRWTEDNFLYELNKKWELSFAGLENQKICGYIVASNTVKDNCHIHRIAIRQEYKGRKIFRDLFNKVELEAKQMNLKDITIEASIENNLAISLYKKKGFAKLSSNQIKQYLQKRKRFSRVRDNYLIESDNSRYFVFYKKIK